MGINDNVLYIFNKIFLNLMKEIKSKDSDIKLKLKEKYKVFDKKSLEYFEYILPSKDEKVLKLISEEQDILSYDEVLTKNIFANISVQTILDKIIKDNEEDKRSFRYYIYILFVLGYIYYIDDIEDDKKEILLRKTIELMSVVNTNTESISEEELEDKIDDILDEDIKTVLRKINRDKVYVKESLLTVESDDMNGMEFLKNTKIGKLAQEISAGIDVSRLNIDDPTNIDPSKLFGGGDGNMFGDIIQTVGTTITDKIASGEINQEELMTEAVSMMGQLSKSGHGDMLSGMMGMMGGMGGMGGMGAMSEIMKNMGGLEGMGDMTNNDFKNSKTRARLQKKLADKNNNLN